MTANTLTLTPGTIDWTQQTVILRTGAGVEHKTTRPISEHPVIIEQQWRPIAFDIVETEDYLSLTPFMVQPDRTCCRVAEFKKALAETNPEGKFISIYPGPTSWDRSSLDHRPVTSKYNDGIQLRIYKDLKMTILRSATLPDGDHTTKVFYVSDIDRRMGIAWLQDVPLQEAIDYAKTVDHITIVENDEEVKQLRKTLTLKNLSTVFWTFEGRTTGDLASGIMKYYHGNYTACFCESTIAKLKEWLNYNDKANDYRRAKYQKKAGVGHNPLDLNELLTWCAISQNQPKQTVDKNAKANEIIAAYKDIWDHPEKHSNEQIWDRRGDDIILLLVNTRGGYYYYSWRPSVKYLFVYNVKTKKRFYGECTSDTGIWSFPIPSLKLLEDTFYPGYSDRWGAPQVTLKVPLVKLFAGTNVEWCLNNAIDSKIKIDWQKDNRNRREELLSFNDYLTEIMGPTIMGILATSGDPLLEQLLKAKLFNLYFEALRRSAHNQLKDIFETEERANLYPYYRRQILFYNKKGKNLQAMFGVPLRVLRAIDAETIWERKSYYGGNSNGYFTRKYPQTCNLVSKLGQQLASADDKTLKYWIKSSVDDTNFVNGMEALADIFPGLTMAAYAQLAEKYRESLSHFKDYANMRTKLINWQTTHPEIEGVFSEKKYPLKPDKATRFLPYVNNMRDITCTWGVRRLSASQFIESQMQRFGKTFNEGRAQIVRNDWGQLLGVVIQMTPAENLRYLHDDAAYWVRFYQDATKDGDFKEAVKRVQPYEWKDEKSGLQIIAPKNIEDLQNEGTVLSHCVGSYVDSIIDGMENIVFLRRIDLPNDPYYTVEVLPSGEIRQVHCYGNGDLTENGQRQAYRSSGYKVYDHDYDIVGFLKKWARSFPGKINADSVKASYRALCAIRR